MIDKERVASRLSFILESCTQLDALARMARAEFLGDVRTVAAAESFLRRALEAVFDVGRHILAKTGHTGLAQEYKSIARGLGASGAVAPEFVPTLERMAGYRNRLVHFYHEVTPGELYTIIVSGRDDLRQFVRYIRDYLSRARLT